MKTALKYGIILGLVNILSLLILNFIKPDLLFNIKLSFALGFIYSILTLILGLREERNNNHGILTFGDGLKNTFISYAMGILIGGIFNYALINHIDDSLIERALEFSLKITEDTLIWTADIMGWSEAQKDKALEELNSPEAIEKMKSNFDLSTIILNSLVAIIFPGFLYWLIIPAIMKRNPAEV